MPRKKKTEEAALVQIAPPRPLAPDEALLDSVPYDPPPGFPQLSAMQHAYLKAWIADPAAEYTTLRTRAGYKGPVGEGCDPSHHPKLEIYRQAIALYRQEQDKARGADPEAMRAEIVARLMRTVRSGDDRDATLASKALESWLEAPDVVEEIAELPLSELRSRLQGILERMGEHEKWLQTVDIGPGGVS